MIRRRLGTVLLTLALLAPGAGAETRVWLIGGGNVLENSQGQIEENVRWLQQIFAEQGVPTRTYYTDGADEDESHDVIFFQPPDQRDPVLEPILRVYGEGLAYARGTRRNTLDNVLGTTEKASLTESLKEDFSRLEPEDSVLLVYNGHGEIDSADTLNNSLILWGDTHLNITELDQLLDQTPTETDVRFVLTQCFSGSFSSLVYKNPRSDQLATQNRCGFLAESEHREAEGCDLGTNQAEFRDYTTYFFAALSGRTRLGEPIPLNSIDLDGSDDVSFYEAHLYTLRNAYSSDLSRSTSETYLEKWEPWYWRWNTFAPRSPDNHYAHARQAIAEQHQLPEAGLDLARERLRLQEKQAGLARERQALDEEIRELQETLRESLGQSPALTDDQTSADRDRLREFAETVTATDHYAELYQHQEAAEGLDEELLTVGRDITQVDKVLRLSRLARLRFAFQRYAGSDAREAMAKLLTCEQSTFNP